VESAHVLGKLASRRTTFLVFVSTCLHGFRRYSEASRKLPGESLGLAQGPARSV